MIFWALLTTIVVIWLIAGAFTKDSFFLLTPSIYSAVSILALAMID